MKRSFAIFLIILLTVAVASAGTLSGKVSAHSGPSVVYVEVSGTTAPAPAQHFLMDQKGLLFQPHLLVVPVGATVDFLNSDKVQHNVFWPSVGNDKKAGHNMGTWPQGQKKAFKFDKPGVVALFCNVHPEMSGYIIVAPSSHYATTDASGDYTIKDVPDGAHNVTAWHEGMKIQTRSVNVSGDTKADFTLSK
jgi:plastocyanin